MAAAMILPDFTAFLGPVAPTDTGFNWRLLAVVRDPQTGNKEILQNYSADTLDSDGLQAIRDKIIAATKAEAAKRGFTVTTAVVLQMNVVTPV